MGVTKQKHWLTSTYTVGRMMKEIQKDTNAQEDVAKSKYALRDIFTSTSH